MIQKFANPRRFMTLSSILIPAAGWIAAITLVAGLSMALKFSPPDYQQGETVRIMYIHVPAAWMALFIYTSMAAASFVALVWKHVLAELYAKAAAPLGAAFTFICLVTGAVWGKPMWGAWWAWDARLTSVLILFFFYLGYMALIDAFDDEEKGLKAGSYLLLIGFINVPIVKFSVEWWNTLHQPASVTRLAAPAIDPAMMWPLVLMAVGFNAFFVALACLRLRTEIMLRRQKIAGAM